MEVLEGVLHRDLLSHALDADTSPQREPVEGYGYIGIGLDVLSLAATVVREEGESLGGGFFNQHIAIGRPTLRTHGSQGGGIGLQDSGVFSANSSQSRNTQKGFFTLMLSSRKASLRSQYFRRSASSTELPAGHLLQHNIRLLMLLTRKWHLRGTLAHPSNCLQQLHCFCGVYLLIIADFADKIYTYLFKVRYELFCGT